MKFLQNDRLSALSSRLFDDEDDHDRSSRSSSDWQHSYYNYSPFSEDTVSPITHNSSNNNHSSSSSNHHHPPHNNSSSLRTLHGRLEAYTMKRTSSDKKYASQLGVKYVTNLQDTLDAQAQASVAAAAAAASTALSFSLPPNWNWTSRGNHTKRRSISEGHANDLVSNQEPQQTQPPLSKKQRKRSNSLDENKNKSSNNVLVYQTAIGDFAAQETRRLMTDFVLTLNASFPDYDFAEVTPNDFVKTPLDEVIQHIESLLAGTTTTTITRNFLSPAFPPPPRTNPNDIIHTTSFVEDENSEEEEAIGVSNNHNHNTISNKSASTSTSPIPFYFQVAGNNSPLLIELWSALDSVIHLGRHCEVYQWTNPPEDLLVPDDTNFCDGGNNGGGNGSSSAASMVATQGGNHELLGNGIGDYSCLRRGQEERTVGTGGGMGKMDMWSFFYLFVNRSLKRLVFFCCCETLINPCSVSAAVAPLLRLGSALDGDETENGGGGGMDAYDDDPAMKQYLSQHHHFYHSKNADAADLVSEDEYGNENEDDEDSSNLHYFDDMIASSSENEDASEDDFDLDPASMTAGGIPVSTV